MIGFNLSAIPSGSTITSASLQMKVRLNLTSGAMTMQAHRMTQVWDEDHVSWLSRTLFDDWAQQGGDYVSPAIDTQSEKPVGEWIVWDITAAVKSWKEDGLANRGILIRTPENTATAYGYTDVEGKMFEFHSSEAGVVANRPKIVITYSSTTPTDDAGAAPMPDAATADMAQGDMAQGDMAQGDMAQGDMSGGFADSGPIADGQGPNVVGSSGCDCQVKDSTHGPSALMFLVLLFLWRGFSRRRRL